MTACKICDNNSLELVLALPNFPLNTIYLNEFTMGNKFKKNLDLYCCPNCGHFQSISEVKIEELYNDDYQYHPTSPNVQNRVEFINEQLLKFKNIKFNRIIDVGCNDTSLLKKLKTTLSANHFIGIDPSISSEIMNENPNDFILFKDYIENIEIPYFDSNLPDLVVSDQTFEHIPNISLSLNHLNNQVSVGSYFAINVPSFEALIEKLNFNFIIHEHLHYFTINTLTYLFEKHKLTLENYFIEYKVTSNYLFGIFSKKPIFEKSNLKPNIYTKHYFNTYFKLFKNMLKETNNILSQISKTEKIYGFGASDITAPLAYFMETDFNYLTNILDDTSYKQNKYYPNLFPQIINSKGDFNDSICLITSPQASRYLINRLKELNFKKIINPNGIIL
jgi:hypothetical protein